MDQLRKAVAWLKQYHFWVLSVLVALISVGCWWKASAKMIDQYKKSETTIKGGFDNVSKVKSETFHANTDVNDKQAAETKKQSEAVKELWQRLYDRQSKDVLKWPGTLSPEFLAAIEKLQFGADILPTLRRNYQNYAQGHFKHLPEIIGARPLQSTGAGAGARGFGGPEGGGPLMVNQLQDDNDYICQWQDADQAFIYEKLYFRDQPSSLAIWVTQEDLWVYETLLRVIAKTNKAANATRMSNAAVKVVAELALGQRASKYSRTSGRLWIRPPAAAAGAPGTGEAPPGTGAGPEGGAGQGARVEMSFDRNSGPMSEEHEKAYLLYGRYLDAQGKPIPFGNPGGGAAAGPEGAGAAEAAAAPAGPLDVSVFGVEYKRLPVRMVLQMDQRWLPRLITQCASEPLQVEVQEVRVNVPEASGANAGPMGSTTRGPEGGGGGGGASAGNLFPEETSAQPFPSHPEIVSVIIQGTIYIFNKPNTTLLQGDQPAATQSAATP